MRKIALIFILTLVYYLSTAQEKLNKLTVPTSPASSILGIQPQAILAPKSYQALETALYSNFLNDEGGMVLPDNFALEFTPYWTKNHGLSLDEYLYPKSGFDQFIRNSSISVASTQSFQLGDSSSSSAIGLGYRTAFYFGNKNDRKKVFQYKKQLDAERLIMANIVSGGLSVILQGDSTNNQIFFNKMREVVVKTMYEYGNFGSIDEAEIFADKAFKAAESLSSIDTTESLTFLNAFANVVEKQLDGAQLFEEFKTYIRQRDGWTVDVAYACFLNFPSNNFNSSVLPKQSVWITPSYRFTGDRWGFLKLMGVLRFEFYNLDYYKKYFPDDLIYKTNIDFGAAVAAEFKMFSLQVEAVGRSSHSELSAGVDENGNELYTKEKDFDFQYIGTFGCNLSDGIVISYSLGNRFDPIQEAQNTLVSLLSLNFGFGSPTKKDLDLAK